jgi:hypothetical protein
VSFSPQPVTIPIFGTLSRSFSPTFMMSKYKRFSSYKIQIGIN